MLETALEHGIDHVPHAPESLRRLFTQLDTIPLWVDWEELNRGGASTLRSGLFGIVVLLCYALPVAYASPEGNKPIAMSGRMLAHSQRRIAETGRFVLETCRAGGLQRWSDGFKVTIRVRLMHAQVRQSLLCASSWRPDEWGAPINQVDMAGTALLLSVQVLDALRRLGVHFSSDEAHAVIQLWRYSGYLLGVDDELLCGSETEARRLAQLACKSMRAPDEHSRALVGVLFKTAFKPPAGRLRWPRGLYEGMARGLLGDDLADRLAIAKPWYARPTVPAIRTVVSALELARRAVPGLNGLATRTGQRLWTSCVEQGLAAAATEAHPAALAIPIQAHI